MPYSFNLTSERWISCVMHDGRQEDLSLLDALTRADEVREIFDESPLVTVALHRLLLAILHRNFGPSNFKAWQSLWKAGKWDAEKITTYFRQWQHRFDLFDENRPFYQIPSMHDAKMRPVVSLRQETSTGNNATLFDHSFSSAPVALLPSQAARYLVATQAFSIAGGNSNPFNFCGAPLTSGISVLALGNNLFETLAINLIIYDEEKPFPIANVDLPIWERKQLPEPIESGTPISGYIDYLTWQSRRIHLIPEHEGSQVAVRWCQLQQNLRLPIEPPIYDPFKCYRYNKEKGYQTLLLNPSKALWRDSHTLFQKSLQPKDKTTRRPEVFSFLARINEARDEGTVEARTTYAFAAYGFASEAPPKTASVLLWTQERLPLPLRYLDDQALVESLGNALGFADDVARILRSSLRYLAKLLLAPSSDAAGARQPDKNDVGKLANRFSAEAFYWSRLEPHFKTLLIALPQDAHTDEYGAVRYGEKTVPEWARTLQRTAQSAFEETTRSLDSSARNLKAVAIAERQFRRTLGAKMKEFTNQHAAIVSTGGDE